MGYLILRYDNNDDDDDDVRDGDDDDDDDAAAAAVVGDDNGFVVQSVSQWVHDAVLCVRTSPHAYILV